MNMRFDILPTDQVTSKALHAAFDRSFSDYVAGPLELTLSQWPGFLRRQGADLSLGRAAVDTLSGAVLAFALVAPRPALARWRLATMGAVPEARGSGAAAALLRDFIQRGKASGLAALELEVFVNNERALRLYRGHGFVERHALQGWSRMGVTKGATPPLDDIERTSEQALAWLRDAERSIADLPLQVSASIISALPAPWTAWQRGAAQLIFSGDRDAGLVIRSLVDRDPSQHDAEALLRTLLAVHDGATVKVPALQRSDLGGNALERCGFEPDVLSQWIMCHPLVTA